MRDQAASQRFYTGILGCTLDHVNEPIRLVQLRFGANLIDLLPGERGRGRRPGPFLPLDPVREPLGASPTSCGRAGWTSTATWSARGAFGSGPSLYIQDPDGYRIELKPR